MTEMGCTVQGGNFTLINIMNTYFQTTFSLDGDILKEDQSGAFTSSNIRLIENGQLVYVSILYCLVPFCSVCHFKVEGREWERGTPQMNPTLPDPFIRCPGRAQLLCHFI